MVRRVAAALVLVVVALLAVVLPSDRKDGPSPEPPPPTAQPPDPSPPEPSVPPVADPEPGPPGPPGLPPPPPGAGGPPGGRPRLPPQYRHTLTGRLVDFAGEPIPNARVDIRAKDGGPVGTYKAHTDGEGRFTFRYLREGTHIVSHDPPGASPVERQVRVVTGDETVCLRMPPGRDLVVRVEDEGGRPIRGAKVRVFDRHGSLSRSPTGPDGTMRFFLTRGFVLARASMRDVEGKPSLLPAGATRLPAEGTPLVLVLREADTVSGRVVMPSGESVPGIVVVAFEGDEEGECAHTDAEGRFSVRVPRGGAVDIAIEGGRKRARLARPSDPYATARVRGVPAGTCDLRVVLTTATWDRSLTLRIEAPDGSPVPGARVQVWSAAPLQPLSDGRSDGEGRLHLSGLPSVRVFPMFEAGDWMSPRSKGLVPNGQTEVFRFRRAVTVRGTVVDGRGRAPGVCRIEVTETGGEHLGGVNTAEDGSFAVRLPQDARLPVTIRARRDEKEEPPNWGLLRLDRLDARMVTLRLDGRY